MSETYLGTSGSGARAGIWSAVVTIDAVDWTARVVGDVRIEAEEDSARIAELTVRPTAGHSFTIAAWVGKSIAIDICDMSTGSPAQVSRLFTGLIDTPELNLDLRTVTLRCTDNLQADLDALSSAAIDALIPTAYYSPVVFDRAAGGWRRAQDRLSTIASSLDLDPQQSVRITAWAPAAQPDLSFDENHILDATLDVSLSSRNSLVNRVVIDFGYRFPRVKAERYPLVYAYVNAGTIAQHAANLDWFLTREAVESAIKAAGATIEAISYTPMPNQIIGGWVPGTSDYLLCMGFVAEVSFGYAQQIEEQHTITVRATNSISVVGTLSDKLSGALEGVYPQIATAEQSMLLYQNDISGIPPLDVASQALGYTTSADVTLTTDTDRTAANDAMETLIAVAKTRIWQSHRRNAVTATVPLNPDVDLDRTIDIAVTGLHARGKCRSVSHVLSPQTGEATTQFSVAICSVAGTGVIHPDTPITAPTASQPASSALPFSATAVFDYAAAGTHDFTVTFPGVDQLERNKANIPIATTYDATLTEDILAITL